ncbi:hypothetical protein COU56_04315, partial [Candidatus Pacearchaeota archaeon CG10_big_fil_rev_8_21_14_0_10_31_9]
SSGVPTQCYNEASSVCLTNGNICSPSPETCNNVDDNCDTTVDSFSESCGLGICAGGSRTCTTGNWGSCSTDSLIINESCNNLDDDCDGTVDESLTQECGTDEGICTKGTQTCSVGNWGTCAGTYIGPEEEVCDGLDNNCNGVIDENDVCGNYPNGTLVSPLDNYISYTGNINFNCSGKDDSGLSNITLYHNINGNMLPNETKIVTGTSNSTIWTINSIAHGTNFNWNCLIYDNESHFSWASNTTYSVNVTILNHPPIVSLIFPENNTLFPGYINDVTFNSSVQDLEGLANCTLYTNVTGTWAANDTSSISGTFNYTNFTMNNLPNGTYLWNVGCFDNDSAFSFAPNNWTFTINYTGESYCQEITEENSVYTLVNDVHSSGTCFNITANNVTIDGHGYTIFYAESFEGKGIYTSGYNNTNIHNLTLFINNSSRTKSPAINFLGSRNFSISNISMDISCSTITSNANCHGISLLNTDYSYISDVDISVSGHHSDGILITTSGPDVSINHRIDNVAIFADGSESSGIVFTSSNGGIDGIFINNSNIHSEDYYGVMVNSGPDILGEGNVYMENTFLSSSVLNRYSLYLQDSESSFIVDSNFSTISGADVRVSGGDHEFLNVSYIDESVSSGNLVRGWYLDIKVNDSHGNDIYQANVSGGDVFGSLDFSELTYLNGKIATKSLAEYVNNGTVVYYNNYTINVTKFGYSPNSATVNFTETQNTFLVITLSNNLPSVSSVIINSSHGTNLTNENLTIYTTATDIDGDDVKNIYNWYKNNQSLTSLYLAFEGSSNTTFTRDYSNRGNNGKVINAIWDSQGGYDNAGAYLFSDLDERVIVEDSDNVDMNSNFTILSWVYPKTDLYGIIMKGDLSDQNDYRFYSWSGHLRFRWGNGSEVGEASCLDCTTQINNWIFLGVVYHCNSTSSSVDFYINGVYNSTEIDDVSCLKSGSNDLWIGSRPNLAYTLNGTIDEVRIYNETLPFDQIMAIYDDNTNIIVSSETETEDSYMCEVIPYDGKEDGQSVNSSELIIVESPNDTYKFYIKDSLGNNVSWLGSEGNIVLKGSCFAQSNCVTNDGSSFIIGNATDSTTAFINSTGDLCIEQGDCSDLSTSCNPTSDAFIIKNSSSANVAYINYNGDLCLTGRLYENSNP